MATLNVESVHLRWADTRECLAGGMSPIEAVQQSIHDSTWAGTHELDGQVAAYWGWRRLSALGSVAQVWMLSTPLADCFPTAFGRATYREFKDLLTVYTTLLVHVHAEHTVAVKWLRRLGFIEIMHVGPFIEMRAYRKGHNPWARS